MSFLKEYTMLKVLGKGGFATVYKVRHNELGYIRAIRVLNDIITDEKSETYRKFLEECKLLLRLGNGTHPNIVHIYQPRLLNNKALVEMDFVDGSNLNKYLEEQNHFLPINDVLRFVSEISHALAYCHENIFRFCMDVDTDNLQSDPNDGSKVLLDSATTQRLIRKYKIIHNDIHSGNVIRKDDGHFVLLDFGLAIEGESVVRSSRRKGGAPEFKAPEKWDNESILSEQSDIYSFGIVLYEMLAGQPPFLYNKKISEYKAEYELGEQHKIAAPPAIEPLRRAACEAANPGKTYEKDYPDWLEEVIMKCLEKKPENRFANGKELFLEVDKNLKIANNKLKQENEELVQEIKKLKKTKHAPNAHIWKILTGIAAVLFIGMNFAYWEKTTGSIEATEAWRKDSIAYKETIEELKSKIGNLQSEKTTLQNENDTLQMKLKNQPPQTVTKEVIKDNPVQAKKIKELERQVKTIKQDRDKWKDRALGSK